MSRIDTLILIIQAKIISQKIMKVYQAIRDFNYQRRLKEALDMRI